MNRTTNRTQVSVWRKTRDIIARQARANKRSISGQIAAIVEATVCEHPVNVREYVKVSYPAKGRNNLTLDPAPRTMEGFYCPVCEQFVFPSLKGS